MTVLFLRPGRLATAVAWVVFVVVAVPVFLLGIYSAFANTKR